MIEKAIRMIAVFSLLCLLSSCTTEQPLETIEAQAVDCDAAQGLCQVLVDGLVVSLSLQQGVVPLKPFTVTAEIRGVEKVGPVSVDFQMVGMDMGPNRYRLIAEAGGWQGTFTLPFCSASRGDWLAVMEFTHATREYRVYFPFTTQ